MAHQEKSNHFILRKVFSTALWGSDNVGLHRNNERSRNFRFQKDFLRLKRQLTSKHRILVSYKSSTFFDKWYLYLWTLSISLSHSAKLRRFKFLFLYLQIGRAKSVTEKLETDRGLISWQRFESQVKNAFEVKLVLLLLRSYECLNGIFLGRIWQEFAIIDGNECQV